MTRVSDEVRTLVASYARAGMTPTQMHRALSDCGIRIGLSTIANMTTALRRAGEPIPRRRGGDVCVIGKEQAARLKPHADVRKVDVPELARRLLAAVVDGQLVDAVLDDEAPR